MQKILLNILRVTYLSDTIPDTGIATNLPNVLAVPIKAMLLSCPVHSTFNWRKKKYLQKFDYFPLKLNKRKRKRIAENAKKCALTRVDKRSSLFLMIKPSH